MATSNDDTIDDLSNNSPLPPELLQLLDQVDQNDGTDRSSFAFEYLEGLLDDDAVSRSGFPPDFNSNSSSQNLPDSINVSQAAAIPSGTQFHLNRLEIIAQPCYTSKLRTREDYKRENRRHTLKARSNPSSFSSPTIRMSKAYSNSGEQCYIGVFLVTTLHEKTNCRYFHPYELEDVDSKDLIRNDTGVWYPIDSNDSEGIKSFPNLRIVLRKEQDLLGYDPLRGFYDYNTNLLNHSVPLLTTGRQMVKEYNLKIMQLAFMIGKRTNGDDICPMIESTVFSNDMTEGDEKGTGEEEKSIQSTMNSVSSPPDCQMYKYAPRRGPTDGEQEVLLFYTKKLEEKKYGNLQVTFRYPESGWSETLQREDIEVKDQMVSFKTPPFPYGIDEITPVDIILQQEKRALQTQRYFYDPKIQCSTCQATTLGTSLSVLHDRSKKRKIGVAQMDDETDAVVPLTESRHELRQSKSESRSHPANTASQISTNSNPTDGDEEKLMDKLEESAVSLFTDDDLLPFLRLCRIFIRKRPQLLHQAIHNNHSDLVTKFISVALISLLQQKNELGETVLLHAVRLNRVNIVKAILNKEKSDLLLDNINLDGQNIFHILSMTAECDELLDLFLAHLAEKSINIEEKFGDADEDNRTPLQLAIVNNNLSATRRLLKYFDQNVCDTSNDTGDNLVHLAVRHGDLAMLKYLLTEGNLNEQGTQTNLTMTPIELARSIKRTELLDYLDERYPQPEVESSDSTDVEDD